MKIEDFPKETKPRERFLQYGPEALSDAELLALILRVGPPGENVIEMSNRLLKEYDMKNLFQCSLKELQKIRGIGETKAIELLSIAEINKRYSLANIPLKKITSAKEVYDLFYEKLKEEKQENFYIMLLDTHNKNISNHLISKGTLDASLIHPREVFRMAIKNASSKIILVHNHPSGIPNPSNADLEITKTLIDAGELLGIKVVDHIIIGNKGYWSYTESN